MNSRAGSSFLFARSPLDVVVTYRGESSVYRTKTYETKKSVRVARRCIPQTQFELEIEFAHVT